MPKIVTCGTVLVMVLLAALTFVFAVQPARANGLVGDLNGDGVVDIKDVSVVAKAFGSYGPNYMYNGSPAHSRWNGAADLDGNNVVNCIDIVIVAGNFGKTISSTP